ncbi:MAG: cupin domain-containing protein [Chloroflexi bacterium]|nr:cupin domain-containing protein [Chloroflexota bacterium]
MEPVSAGREVYIQILIPPDEGPNFAMRRFTFRPGGWMPKHTNRVEHEQYVLQGQGLIGIGEQTFRVQPGDVVFIPAGVPHWYKNVGDEDFVFLCLVPNQPDEVVIVDPREPTP